jgi:hypothetical protein
MSLKTLTLGVNVIKSLSGMVLYLRVKPEPARVVRLSAPPFLGQAPDFTPPGNACRRNVRR